MKKVYVIKNRYVDSVTLMGVAVELTELPGVTGAESGMGTSQNVDLLTGLDYPGARGRYQERPDDRLGCGRTGGAGSGLCSRAGAAGLRRRA